MVEKFIEWKPLSDIPKTLIIRGVHDDDEGFRVILKEPGIHGRILRVFFEFPLAYRNINESYLLRTIEQIKNISSSTLFTIENSVWLDCFHEESLNVYRDQEITHYSIMSSEDCIDVLSELPPRVEWQS